jgi:hypothetical protein
VYSAVKNNDYIILSISPSHIVNMMKHIGKTEIGNDDIAKLFTPKNIDIISFVNDLAIKNKIASKYMITTDIDTYHPHEYIWHQSKYNNGICNVIIKDAYDVTSMGDPRDTGAEECPGTKKLADMYISAYDNTQKKVLNQNSLYIRSGGGIFSIIERNLSDFVTYLSWVKLNDAMKFLKMKNPEVNTDLASSFEIIQKTDSTVFDIVRSLKESKDSSFFMVDGKTGTKIKMMVDSNIPEVQSDVTEKYYHDEFMNNIAAFRAGTVGSVTAAIKSADERIKRSMSVGVSTGLQLATALQKQGWVQKTVGGRECFVYPGRVNVTTFVDNSHKRYTLPEECQEIMYLYDITVPINPCIYGISSDADCVKARGFHPHRAGSGGGNAYGELTHVKDLNRLCIGDLDGKPIEKIVNLIDALSGAYEPSMMGNMASRCINCLTGYDIAGAMSSDTKSPDVKKMLDYIDPILKNRGFTKKAKSTTDTTIKTGETKTKKTPAKGATIFSTS